MIRAAPLPPALQSLHRELLRHSPMDPDRVHGIDGDGTIGVTTRQVAGRDVVFVTLLRPAWQLLDDRQLARAAGLAPRHAAVARRLALRLTDPEIANELGLKVATVRRYVESVLARLQVHSRREVDAVLRHRVEAALGRPVPRLRVL
jgi:DNA-binding CsgD family transcriptional regulator